MEICSDCDLLIKTLCIPGNTLLTLVSAAGTLCPDY